MATVAAAVELIAKIRGRAALLAADRYSKAWSDEARAAAAEARKAKARLKSMGEEHEEWTGKEEGKEYIGKKARNSARDSVGSKTTKEELLNAAKESDKAAKAHYDIAERKKTEPGYSRDDRRMIVGTWKADGDFHSARADHFRVLASKLK